MRRKGKEILKNEKIAKFINSLPRKDQIHIKKVMTNDLDDALNEYYNEEDGWQILSDLFGNIDIYDDNGAYQKSLFTSKDGEYSEPTEFISNIISASHV